MSERVYANVNDTLIVVMVFNFIALSILLEYRLFFGRRSVIMQLSFNIINWIDPLGFCTYMYIECFKSSHLLLAFLGRFLHQRKEEGILYTQQLTKFTTSP